MTAARKYQLRATGKGRPGKTRSRTRNADVAITTSMEGSVTTKRTVSVRARRPVRSRCRSFRLVNSRDVARQHEAFYFCIGNVDLEVDVQDAGVARGEFVDECLLQSVGSFMLRFAIQLVNA